MKNAIVVSCWTYFATILSGGVATVKIKQDRHTLYTEGTSKRVSEHGEMCCWLVCGPQLTLLASVSTQGQTCLK